MNKRFCKHCGKELTRNKHKDSNRKRGWGWECLNGFASRKFCNPFCYANWRIGRKGKECSEETRKKMSKIRQLMHKRGLIEITKNQYGEKNLQWKNGRSKHTSGYLLVRKPEHPRSQSGYIFEHILIAEKKIGRFIKQNESVHHINGIRTDNRLENLSIMTVGEHTSLHNNIRYKRKISKPVISLANTEV